MKKKHTLFYTTAALNVITVATGNKTFAILTIGCASLLLVEVVSKAYKMIKESRT